MTTERRHNSPSQKLDVLQVTADLRRDFVEERPGWTERYFRRLGEKMLEVAKADETIAFEASTIAAEFLRNATKHGGGISEFTVVHATGSGNAPETVYIVATNPANDEAGTPGTARRGSLAADSPNHEAESGRGLLMTDAYTDHNWGQQNVTSPDGKHEIVTFAILSKGAEERSTLYEDVA